MIYVRDFSYVIRPWIPKVRFFINDAVKRPNFLLKRQEGIRKASINQRTLAVGVSITVQLVSSLTGLDSATKENMLFFVCGKCAES